MELRSKRRLGDIDEVYADARRLLGPLVDVLGEGGVVHSCDSGLVDYSQSGGD